MHLRLPHPPPALLALAAAALFAGSPTQASASTIFWGSDFQSSLYDSNANPLDASFSFEIGSFGSFIPTEANINEWVNHWKVFDRAYDPDANGWNTADQFFVGTVEHTLAGGSNAAEADPLSVFLQGEVAYLWVFNTKDRLPTTEWALVTDGAAAGDAFNDWLFPDPNDQVSSFDWQLADANTAIFGGVNNVQAGDNGGFVAPAGNFNLQTHTVPVPEPGSALLMLIGASAWVVRRRVRYGNLPVNFDR